MAEAFQTIVTITAERQVSGRSTILRKNMSAIKELRLVPTSFDGRLQSVLICIAQCCISLAA